MGWRVLLTEAVTMMSLVVVATFLVTVLVSARADYGEHFRVEPSNPCNNGEHVFCSPKWCPEDPSTPECFDTSADCSDLEDCFDEIALTAFDCKWSPSAVTLSINM